MEFERCFIYRYDKYGKPIYEGDFIKHTNGTVYQVVWRYDILAFGIESDGVWELFDEYLKQDWTKI